jgi:endonuclease III
LIHQLTVDDLRRILQTFPIKPRYLNAAAQTIKDVSELVVTKFNGHAEKIWLNQTALEVESVLRQISNVGPGLASMIVILLERCFKIQFSDHQVMDIKPDVNFIRVFFRLGLIDEMETRKALKKARELHPEYPGELDPAAWWIGKKYCLPKKPMCLDCPLLDLCQFTIGGEHEKNNRNRSGKIVE